MEHFDIQNLTFSHAAAKGKLSLDGVSLRIRAGEFLVLCGRSGSGKTTLLRHLKTVLTPNGKRSARAWRKWPATSAFRTGSTATSPRFLAGRSSF